MGSLLVRGQLNYAPSAMMELRGSSAEAMRSGRSMLDLSRYAPEDRAVKEH
ncbi:hypothetical protein [Sorangium sp. So ce1335]|uniref:hypothetical protein n=1 Tax=Sorangium sp. So ce1335 TaxID=3133335 RepID=UPI003F639BF2